MLKFLYVIEIS